MAIVSGVGSVEIRICQFCRKSAVVYRDGLYTLVKYSVRHYAHPQCIATRKGRIGTKDLIPGHQHRSFDVAMLDADDTTSALADLVDRRNARANGGGK